VPEGSVMAPLDRTHVRTATQLGSASLLLRFQSLGECDTHGGDEKTWG
jgi:hypothetical protein